LLKGKGGFGVGDLPVGVRSLESEVFMAQMTSQVSEILEKALTLSAQERGLLIDRLVESLDDEPAEGGLEAAWDEEIKRRVDDIRSGRVKTIPGEQVLRELAEEFPDGE
jgi:putative addiction module component (TIGR02574 family)